MDIVKSQVMELKKLWKNKRQLLFQGLNLAMIVFSALMIWKGLMVVTKSESPVVVVLRYATLFGQLLEVTNILSITHFLVDLWSLHFNAEIFYF